MGKRLTVMVLAAYSGAALAQAPLPLASLQMPASVTQIGDPDAACIMASMVVLSSLKASKELTPEAREKGQETARLQMAYFLGKLVARVELVTATHQLTEIGKKWYAKNPVIDKMPAIRWCQDSYNAHKSSFGSTFDNAGVLIEKMMKDTRIKPTADAVDPNALCTMWMGAALPQEEENAKTSADARVSASNLRQAQTYFIGKVLITPRKGLVEERLATALIYVQQRIQAKDEKAIRTGLVSCIDQFWDARSKALGAMVKGLELGNSGLKPAK